MPARPSTRDLLTLVLTLVLFPACAGPSSEQHLAPFYTHISTPNGGVDHEALAGAVIARRSQVNGPITHWGLRPFFIHYHDEDQRTRTQFLYPFGRVARSEGELKWWLLPLADYRREHSAEGRKWSLLALPGVYLARFPDGRRTQAWFPFGGHVEEVLTWDKLDFILWPIWTRSERQGRVTHHILFPFFSWTEAPDGGGWRAWPVVGNSWVDDRYDRWFGAWPLFSYNKENLKSSPRYHQTQWALFPLYGRVEQGTYKSHSVLWPFFGYASDSATGFWAWDGPWPLVRIMRPGNQELVPLPRTASKASRTRFWPFWSYYEGDGLESTWYAWPLVNKRKEHYELGDRDAFTIVPIWQSFDRRDKDGGGLAYQKLWPLYQFERERSPQGEDTRRYLFPQLNPLWRWPNLDEHYSWLYEVYNAEIGPATVHERALLGLWRREVDRDEERMYISGLWSRRVYSRGVERVTEHSILFGLLRWRSSPSDGLGLLRPALPGPGWPIERTPRDSGR